MHYRTTLLLLLFVCVLGVFIWIVEWKPSSYDNPQNREQKLLDVDLEQIGYVSFYRDGMFIECVNEHDRWFINKPIRARSDNSKINRLLVIMEMLPKGEAITLAERQARELTLDDYGLMNPRARIVLGEKEKRYKLTIGKDSPLKDAVYVRLGKQDSVIVTSTNVLNVIPCNVNDIRDTKLLQGSPSYVSCLEIKRHDGPMIQMKKEGAEWILHKPVISRADWIKMSSLLKNLFSMRIQHFVSETMADPAAYGLSDDEAILQVNLWQNEKTIVTKLFFGKDTTEKGDMVYANCKDSSSIYAVRKSEVEAVQITVNDIRDSHIYFMPKDNIVFIQIEKDGKVLQLHKDDKVGWRIDKPKQWPANSRVVNDLFSRINSLRIEAFVDGAVTNLQAFGLDKPSTVIRVADAVPLSGTVTQAVSLITLPPGGTSRSLKLSCPQPGKAYIYAQFEGELQVYQISASAASTFPIEPLPCRDTTVMSLDPSMIRTITLKKNGREQTVERVGETSWKLIEPATGQVNKAVIRNILVSVSDLSVLRFEGWNIPVLSVYGLKDASVSLTLRLTGEKGIQKSLIFGEPSEDLGVYTMLQGQDVVFILEKEVAGFLTTDFIY